jgi:hypothetical protein
MNDGVRILEAGAKCFAQIDVSDFLRGQRIHQSELIDVNSHAARGFADAEIIEGMKRVRSKLDTGADFTERGRFLQDEAANTLLREAERRRQAANTPAGD